MKQQKISVLIAHHCKIAIIAAAGAMTFLSACNASDVISSKKNPANTAYRWQNVKVIAGGFITGIVFNPNAKGRAYVRTDIGGAYRWDDKSKTWIPITDWVSPKDSNLLGTESIAFDPKNPDRIYIAQGTYVKSWAGKGAIFRSDDNGATWKCTNIPFQMGANEDGRSAGERLAVDPNNSNILYIGSRVDGLWRSEDAASTWTKVSSFPVTNTENNIGICFVIFDPSSVKNGRSQVIYAGFSQPNGVYRSVDGGKTWVAVPGQPNAFLPHQAKLTKNGVLYITYGDQPGPNGMSDGAVWRYNTKSGVWDDISPIHPHKNNEGGFGFAGLAIDAQHPGVVMVSTMDRWWPGDDVFRSLDGGGHWTGLKANSMRDGSLSPYVNWGKQEADFGHWIGALAIDPFNSSHVLYGTGATIWGSHDVTNADAHKKIHWSVEADGIEETAVSDLISPPAGAPLLSAMPDVSGFRHDSLDKSPTAGTDKAPIFSSASSIDFAEKKPNVIVKNGWANDGIRAAYSKDGGLSWTMIEKSPAQPREPGSITIAPDAFVIIWSMEDGVYYTSVSGSNSWTKCDGVPPGSTVFASRDDASKFYAYNSREHTLLISTNDGKNFKVQNAKLPEWGSRMRAVAGHEKDLWLPDGDNGLWHSTDDGVTFTKIASVQACNAVGFGKAALGRTYPAIYISAKVNEIAGIYRSDNEGKSWVRINDDQHQYGWIGTLTGDSRVYGRVYLSTNGRGIVYGDLVK